MGQVDAAIGELEPASERARKILQQKITKQKTKRFYRTAKNQNFGESQKLNIQLKTYANEEHEFKRTHSANQLIFRINRRRHIASSELVQVDHEIKTLQEKRHQSTMISKLSVSKDIDDAAKHITNAKEAFPAEILSDTPLPGTVMSALHEGVPTILSRPKMLKRIKTAPVSGRQPNNLLSSESQASMADPLQMLKRVETSDGFLAVRDRLVRKKGAVSVRSDQQKTARDFPRYLALDPLEAISIRTNIKQQAVNKCKQMHAGSDEQCSFLVKKWLEDLDTK